MDPHVNINELTSDAIAYAEDRFRIVNQVMGKLVQKYTKEGQSFAELRSRYGTLLSQRFSMASAVSRYVGGIYIDRSFPEQKSTSKPYTPVPLATQKRAIGVLNKYIFAPNAFDADAQVFAYLQPQRRGFTQNVTGDDYRITDNILTVQTGGALSHLLHGATLERITNSRLYGNQYSVAALMGDLQKGIFNADIATNVNVYRENLQTYFVRQLVSMVDPKNQQFDDVSKAAALYTLKRIKAQLATAVSTNEETKAHRANLLFLIQNAMENK
jgi:hypothetical protein